MPTSHRRFFSRRYYLAAWEKLRRRAMRLFGGSLIRRIVLLNLVGLIALLYGILYLNQFQAGLIDARVQSLLIQGEIIARAIAGTATVDGDGISLDTRNDQAFDPDDERPTLARFSINPARVGLIVKRLLQPARLRARVYDKEGALLLDSRLLFSKQVQQKTAAPTFPSTFSQVWKTLSAVMPGQNLPRYQEKSSSDTKPYPEIGLALDGRASSIVRVNDSDEMIVFVAVPIQRQRQMVGALLLSTMSGDIDAIVQKERMAIFQVFIVAALVMALLSVLMARTIVDPLRRLAAAADRVRRGTNKREEIPDFTKRLDEVGDLSGSLRDMTSSLYNRIEAIESFAADVAHELKNPLTSLRSAVETLPLAKRDEDKSRLLEVITHDVKRLDRLITDISAASRLDAELQRHEATRVDMPSFLSSLVGFYIETHEGAKLTLQIKSPVAKSLAITGYESRLGQVFVNLIENAFSFSPTNGEVRLMLERKDNQIIVTVEDEGPGIKAEPPGKIFDRFFTDRPESDFGSHSGLGLSISKQIVEAHRGQIEASNVIEGDLIKGARFTLTFPAVV